MYANSNVKAINIHYDRRHQQHMMKKSRAHTHNGKTLMGTQIHLHAPLSNFNEGVQTVKMGSCDLDLTVYSVYCCLLCLIHCPDTMF